MPSMIKILQGGEHDRARITSYLHIETSNDQQKIIFSLKYYNKHKE